MNNENECPVCFCSMDQCEFKLYCGHEIHGKCMFKHAEQYLRLHNNLLDIKVPCPICRSQLHCIEDTLRSTIFNNYDVFRYLIDKGADVNIRHSSGKTPLDLAVECCFNDMILHIELM